MPRVGRPRSTLHPLRPLLAPLAYPHSLSQQALTLFATDRTFTTGEADQDALWPEGDPGEKELRQACRTNLRLFCETFFPEVCRHPFNPLHDDVFRLHDQRVMEGLRGWKDVTAAPRGSGKTTIKQIEVVHDCLYKIEKYIGVGSANFDHARDKVQAIRDIFMENAELIRVYGPQETGVPGHDGRWREHDFITRTGVRVRAFTPKMKTRGFLWNGSRLTKALFDDVEDQELVLTELRRDRLMQWLSSDIAKLGEADLNMDGIGTILHEKSMLAQLLQNPGFNHRFYQAVVRFAHEGLPEAEQDVIFALWGEWRDIALNLDDPDRMAHAHAFYLAHEQAMLGNAEVFWPEAQSYEYLMLDRLTFGETAFFTERQNTPMMDARYIFNMDQAIYFHTYDDALGRQDGKLIHFMDMTAIAGYWDPTPDRAHTKGDYTCFVVAMKDKYGYLYLVDAYCEREPSTDVAMDAIVDLIWHWRVPQVGIEANSFASLLTNELRRKIEARAQAEHEPWAVSFLPIKNMKNKILRIKSLDPLIANGWLAFAETLPPQFLQQFKEFVPLEGANDYDDSPDSVEGVCRVLGGLFDRRAAF